MSSAIASLRGEEERKLEWWQEDRFVQDFQLHSIEGKKWTAASKDVAEASNGDKFPASPEELQARAEYYDKILLHISKPPPPTQTQPPATHKQQSGIKNPLPNIFYAPRQIGNDPALARNTAPPRRIPQPPTPKSVLRVEEVANTSVKGVVAVACVVLFAVGILVFRTQRRRATYTPTDASYATLA